MLLKHTCITHTSWSYFFSHFGHPNIAIKSSLGVSDLGTTRVKGICQIRAFLNSCASPALDPFCSPVWREEEPGAAFKHLSSLLLPKWRRGWDRPMAGISKDCSHSFSAPLPDQPDLTLKTEASEQVNPCKKCQQNLILLIQNSSWVAPWNWVFIFPSCKSFPQSKDIWELCKSFLETFQALHLSKRKINVS